MSRTLTLATLSLLSGAAYAADPNPNTTTTQKEVVKTEVKDDQTGVALAALDEALQRNAKQAFDANGKKAIDALEARKAMIGKVDSDAVDPDIKRAKDKMAEINKMQEGSAWKNAGMELKTQLTAIDKRLDQAELNKGTAGGTPPGTAGGVPTTPTK
jgi:hypothetical protein